MPRQKRGPRSDGAVERRAQRRVEVPGGLRGEPPSWELGQPQQAARRRAPNHMAFVRGAVGVASGPDPLVGHFILSPCRSCTGPPVTRWDEYFVVEVLQNGSGYLCIGNAAAASRVLEWVELPCHPAIQRELVQLASARSAPTGPLAEDPVRWVMLGAVKWNPTPVVRARLTRGEAAVARHTAGRLPNWLATFLPGPTEEGMAVLAAAEAAPAPAGPGGAPAVTSGDAAAVDEHGARRSRKTAQCKKKKSSRRRHHSRRQSRKRPRSSSSSRSRRSPSSSSEENPTGRNPAESKKDRAAMTNVAGSSREPAGVDRETFLDSIQEKLLFPPEAVDIVAAYDRGDRQMVELLLARADGRHERQFALAAQALPNIPLQREASSMPSSPMGSSQPGSVPVPDGSRGP
jgi:hypothetical protein